jgi:transposase
LSAWSKPQQDRYQYIMLEPSLDEQLPKDCGVRGLDAMLGRLDWSEWEGAYAREGAGRPPLHPRYVAGCFLYGLIKGIRSLRELEEATRMRLDMRWLMDCQTVDHSTLCYFRQRFEDKIADLFKQLNRRAAREHKLTLAELLIDGTRVRADSDRHGARTAAGLQAQLEALEVQINEALQSMPEESASLPGSTEELQKRLAALDARRQKVERALEVARERDETKRDKEGRNATPVRVPVTDPDAHIMPNKEGGYAPNYTPVLAVDGASGLIVSACVAEGNSEAAAVAPLMEQAREIVPDVVERVLCDSGFSSGANLQQLKQARVTVYAPAGEAGRSDNPAVRPDTRQPVPEEAREALPMHGKQLDRAAFIYDAAHDLYRCPMGREMLLARTTHRNTAEGTVPIGEYRCVDCSNCPLAPRCVRDTAAQRMICRDVYEPLREELAQRMRTEQARDIYARRAPIGEGVFAGMKRNMGIRRFTRRGRRLVDVELIWICMAYNLRKLLRMALKGSQTPTQPQTLLKRLASLCPDPIYSVRSLLWCGVDVCAVVA